ncbi:MAG TPA: ElyC/SanA/YdcF family protein [Longimicrobiales bacterium]|nr:ElyC/SanA/YdcF family protein [Longimicrobiales bacterium]
MLFTLKKIIGALIMPFSAGAAVLVAGVVLLWLAPRRMLGRVLVTAGTAFLLASGCGPLTNALVRPLDTSYPVADIATMPSVGWVVVLGSGHHNDPSLPPTIRLTGQALSRLVEGIRIHNAMPGSRLLVSGGAVWDSVAHANVLAEAALVLGVDSAAIVVEPRPRDTDDEARLIGERIGSTPFVLVTSASHMPRALALFRAQGTNPIPAPTDFGSTPQITLRPEAFLPTSSGLRNSERAVKEYVGRIWAWLTQ